MKTLFCEHGKRAGQCLECNKPTVDEASSHTERWVLISIGDGYETRIVEGQEALERAFLELHFGPTRPASECTPGEIADMEGLLAHLRCEEFWLMNYALGHVAYEISHEDGRVLVYRLTDARSDDERVAK